jgi:hypothetical protein
VHVGHRWLGDRTHPTLEPDGAVQLSDRGCDDTVALGLRDSGHLVVARTLVARTAGFPLRDAVQRRGTDAQLRHHAPR